MTSNIEYLAHKTVKSKHFILPYMCVYICLKSNILVTIEMKPARMRNSDILIISDVELFIC